jgi:hypothetical protein
MQSPTAASRSSSACTPDSRPDSRCASHEPQQKPATRRAISNRNANRIRTEEPAFPKTRATAEVSQIQPEPVRIDDRSASARERGRTVFRTFRSSRQRSARPSRDEISRRRRRSGGGATRRLLSARFGADPTRSGLSGMPRSAPRNAVRGTAKNAVLGKRWGTRLARADQAVPGAFQRVQDVD